MIIFPSLKKFTKERPARPRYEASSFVPDFKKYTDFWDEQRKVFLELSFSSPLMGDFLKKIDKETGFFGEQIHPITKEPAYYHVGVAINAKAKQQVRPLLKGVLEYSGFHIANGYYVLLSHPQVQTEDGYIFHTMYCHLKKPLVSFTSYQKMLREISLGTYPVIEIDKNTVLGLVGNTGNTIGTKPKLYLQTDFRKDGEKPIVVDPMSFFSEK